MNGKKTPKLELTAEERAAFKRQKIKIADLADYSVEELCSRLRLSQPRTRELRALAEFQRIPSIGPQFARDMVELGYFSLEELKQQDGAQLFDALEQRYGFEIDPCVEDQCRLIVDFARHRDGSRQWWDFTAERKQYRDRYGYPLNRPKKE
ncbi:Pathogenicity locus [Paenibacillus dendritiformis]|uniref:helix-hairpin-helix domain-containing protein n=1 Tax=Paenibacillus dendritiformis TaxID=130049 RepID=UPI001F55956D|nr:helix-hairpin-helix domain-containing protein [Paenibacillus dendritiformis]MBG9794969.1 Pathogenicity locus [Paenibacillus dendritiformis]